MDRVYNKLVRDRIPEIIKAKGEEPITRELSLDEFKFALETKLKEECQEVITASGKDRIEEIADTLEVLEALAKLEGATLEDVITVADKKCTMRGAFDERIFLEKVIQNPNNNN